MTGLIQAPPHSGSAPSGPRGIVSAHISGLLRLPRTTRCTSSCWFHLRRPPLHLSDDTCTGLQVAPRRSFKPRARFFFLFNVFGDKINFLFFCVSTPPPLEEVGAAPPVSAARRLRLPTSAWVLAQSRRCHIASVRVAANRNINTAETRERSCFSFFFSIYFARRPPHHHLHPTANRLATNPAGIGGG